MITPTPDILFWTLFLAAAAVALQIIFLGFLLVDRYLLARGLRELFVELWVEIERLRREVGEVKEEVTEEVKETLVDAVADVERVELRVADHAEELQEEVKRFRERFDLVMFSRPAEEKEEDDD